MGSIQIFGKMNLTLISIFNIYTLTCILKTKKKNFLYKLNECELNNLFVKVTVNAIIMRFFTLTKFGHTY